MIKGCITIQSPMGLHASPAAQIASRVLDSESDVIIKYHDQEIDPGNYFKLLSLRIQFGEEVEMIVEGSDEKEVFADLSSILQSV